MAVQDYYWVSVCFNIRCISIFPTVFFFASDCGRFFCSPSFVWFNFVFGPLFPHSHPNYAYLFHLLFYSLFIRLLDICSVSLSSFVFSPTVSSIPVIHFYIEFRLYLSYIFSLEQNVCIEFHASIFYPHISWNAHTCNHIRLQFFPELSLFFFAFLAQLFIVCLHIENNFSWLHHKIRLRTHSTSTQIIRRISIFHFSQQSRQIGSWRRKNTANVLTMNKPHNSILSILWFSLSLTHFLALIFDWLSIVIDYIHWYSFCIKISFYFDCLPIFFNFLFWYWADVANRIYNST